jgi:hypothetical protein
MLSTKYVAPSEIKIKNALIDARTGQAKLPYVIPAPFENITINPINPNHGVKNTTVFHFTIDTATS